MVKLPKSTIVLLSLIIAFYIWTTTYGTYNFSFQTSWGTKYNLLTDSFLAGKLNLPIEPSPALKDLPDPYDCVANKLFRGNIYDLAYYKGKVYMYQGITPIITLYLPYRVITKNRLPDAVVVLIYMLGVLVWGTLLIYHLRNKYFDKIPQWLILLSITVIGLANYGLFLLRTSREYEVPIACACFFLTAAISSLCFSIDNLNTSLKLKWLTLGSLFLGLSIGGRMQIIFSAVLLPIIWFLTNKKVDQNLFKIKSALALTIPFSICILFFGIYNYLRFEDITNFGYVYVLGDPTVKPPFNFKYIIPNLYSYLFQTPTINSVFPFIHLNIWHSSYDLPWVYERIIGIFPGAPFILLLLLSPILIYIEKLTNNEKNNNVKFPYKEFFIIILPGLLNFVILLNLYYVTLRYIVDFYNYFLLASCIILFYLYSRLLNRLLLKKTLIVFVFLVSTISILTSIAASIVGNYDDLSRLNNLEYKKIESFLNPVSKILFKIL